MTEDAYDTFPIIAKELLFFFFNKVTNMFCVHNFEAIWRD